MKLTTPIVVDSRNKEGVQKAITELRNNVAELPRKEMVLASDTVKSHLPEAELGAKADVHIMVELPSSQARQ